ncbi:MFS transporter [Sphingobium sp. JS3065]|uniref:MFS transporter n=1 Tax=Sphingobium sp. JS3065 TaxID=2970925 RepID=UPI002264F13C|nr:MFS transporter [Sphingobium sp. JS3065]UZW57412.1 MFS transporter [Sphingobium sp. JS3065]
MRETPPTSRSEWARGWKTVVSGTLGASMSSLPPSALGIVLAPLTLSFDWSRTTVAASVTIITALALLLAPLAGRMIVRWGARSVALASVTLSAFGFFGFALAGGDAWTWIAASVVFGVLSAAAGPIVWTTGVASLFDRQRGLALSIVLSGSGLSFMAVPMVALSIMEAWGWRAVYCLFAALSLFIYLPVAWAWFARDDCFPAAATRKAAAPTAAKQGAGQSMRSARFCLLALFTILMAAVEGAFMIHLFPILQEGGIEPRTAALAVSTLGVGVIVGRLLGGLLLDRIAPSIVLGGMVASLALASVAAWLGQGSFISAIVIAVALGFGLGGTTSAIALLASRHFAMSAYASIFGTLVGISGLCFGLAPTIAAQVRELTGSYTVLFPAALGMLAVAVVFLVAFNRNVRKNPQPLGA